MLLGIQKLEWEKNIRKEHGKNTQLECSTIQKYNATKATFGSVASNDIRPTF